MIRTGEEYKASLQDGREVYISGKRVKDVTTHPMFEPLVDIRTRIYDMQHDATTNNVMAYKDEQSEEHAIELKMPHNQQDWHDKSAPTDAVFDDIGGVVTCVGDDTVSEMWSLFDGPAEMAGEAAGLSDQVLKKDTAQVAGQDAFLGTAAAAVKSS